MPETNTNIRIYRLILATLVAGCLIYHFAILWASRNKIAAGYGDFIIFYTGAQIINDGKSRELFKIETQNAYQAKFDIPQLEWPLPFNHAPYELFLFVPLAHLSYPLSHAIWSSINLLFLVIFAKWMVKYVNSQHKTFAVALLCGWFPTMEALRMGQDSIMSTMLLLAVFVALKRKREAWAGFWLAIGLYKPQLVVPMAGAFLVARCWRGLTAFGVTGAILGSVSVAMVGWQGVFDFISILKNMSRYSYIIYPANMPNIRGLLIDSLRATNFESIVFAATVIISLLLYALCLYCWRGKFDVLDPRFDLKFSLTIVTTLLISYHFYPHDLFTLTLALILIYRYINSGCTTYWAFSSVVYFLLIVAFIPLIPRYLIKYSALGWATVPVLFLYTILIVEVVRSTRLGFTEFRGS
jgi:Glycosyltransferase family 87